LFAERGNIDQRKIATAGDGMVIGAFSCRSAVLRGFTRIVNHQMPLLFALGLPALATSGTDTAAGGRLLLLCGIPTTFNEHQKRHRRRRGLAAFVV
jgi:hypothetical protein